MATEYKLPYTGSEISQRLAKIDSLAEKSEIPTVPTNVSAFNNDKGYLTAIPSEYITETELTAKGYLTEHQSLADYAKTADLGDLATKDIIMKTDLSSDVQTSLGKADTALQSYTETDPTVPSWAKASTKPTYTASEVGAVPTTRTINGKALSTNITLSASDVGALPNTTTIPSALADLTADATHRLVTDTEKSTWNDKANVSDIPTKVSDLTNDSGYIKSYTETDPTVPSWAKASTKPSYTKSEVGLGNVDNVKQYSASNPPPYPVTSVNSKTGAITLSASDVGADASGTASSTISSHNTNTSAHEDIREQISQLSDTLGTSVLYTTQNLTEAQKAQARANIGATAGEDVEFADSLDWLNENGDTSKKYVLPDGYIYYHTTKTVDVVHNANDGTMLLNTRHVANSSMSNTTAHNGVFLTQPIAIDQTWSDCAVNISGLSQLVEVYYAPFYAIFYKADGSWIGYTWNQELGVSGTTLALPVSLNLKLSQHWSKAAYVRLFFGIKTTAISQSDVASLVINMERLNTTETVSGWFSTGRQHSNDQATQQNSADIATLKEDVETLKEAVQKSPTQSGAVWYALGDSITYGTRGEPPTQTLAPVVGQRWVDYVAKYNGYELTNLGVSGSGFVTGTTLRTVIDGNDFTNVDIVTLMMGINDWKNTEAVNKVGTMDDAVGETYTDKIIPEMRYAFEKILSENPYCKIFFITPINARVPYNNATEATNWSYGYTGSGFVCGNLISFIEKLKEVCEYYNVQIIDMTKGSVVNRKNINTMLPDGLHPCLDGYKALGTELARRITFA